MSTHIDTYAKKTALSMKQLLKDIPGIEKENKQIENTLKEYNEKLQKAEAFEKEKLEKIMCSFDDKTQNARRSLIKIQKHKMKEELCNSVGEIINKCYNSHCIIEYIYY